MQAVSWSPSEWLFSLRYRPSRFCLVKRVKKLRTEPQFFFSLVDYGFLTLIEWTNSTSVAYIVSFVISNPLSCTLSLGKKIICETMLFVSCKNKKQSWSLLEAKSLKVTETKNSGQLLPQLLGAF